MNPSAKLNTEEQQQAELIFNKLAPAIAEMMVKRDSGEITIYFHEGHFKRAKKTVTVQ